VWGLGHLALGERRGWALLLLEAAWVVALAASALAFLHTDLWLVVFGVLAAFLVAWAAQAVDAFRRARARAVDGSGAGSIFALVPVAVALVTAFWLTGGREATPGGTVEQYVHAWLASQPGVATRLFVTPPTEEALAATWRSDSERLRSRLGPDAAGIDLDDTFDDLRFESVESTASAGDTVTIELLLVERARVPTTVFGVLPASVPETRVVAVVGRAILRRVPVGPSLLVLPAAGAWHLERMEVD